jgi:YidC/Oxa1 family membrane protein insertase
MDRRTLLAIVLIMAVLIADQFYLAHRWGRARRPAIRTTQSADTTRSTAAPGGAQGTSVSPAPSGGEIPAPAASAGPGGAVLGIQATRPHVPPAPIVRRELVTPHFRASLTSEGGGIAAWVLPEYPDLARNKEPVNLVSPAFRTMRVTVTTPLVSYDFTDALFRTEYGASDSSISFVAEDSSGVRVQKTYRLTKNTRALDVELRISAPPQLGPIRYRWGWGSPLPNTELRPAPRSMQAVALVGDRLDAIDPMRLSKAGPKGFQGNVRWVGDRSKYFVAALIPDSATFEDVQFSPTPTGQPTSWLVGAAPPGTHIARHARLYAGPIHYDTLVAQGAELDRLANLGWRWITGLSALLLWALNALHKILPNYGIAIILLSAATKLVFYPLTQASLRSMKVMHHLQPEVKSIQERFKGDPQGMNRAMMDLYKRHKVNPLSGCLPMLIQIPVFFALYNVLLNSIELRGAGFLGYVQDLSVPDVLVTIGGFPVHAFPILMTGSTYFMQLQTPVAPQQRATMMLMPIMMLVFMYNFPSGVVLYWTVTNLISAVQQYLVNVAEDRRMAAGG